MKKSIAMGTALAVTIFATVSFIVPFNGAAASTTITVGNPAVSRAVTDTYQNFTVIDTNNPVSANGWLSTFTYYAAYTKPFEFVLVDPSNVVQWVSPTITPATTGVQTYSQVVPVQAGWNLGVHFDLTGTIPFDYTGTAPAPYTPNNFGIPTVGVALTIEGTSNRIYSWGATGTSATTCSSQTLVSGTNIKSAGWTETTQAPSTSLLATSYTLGNLSNSAVATQTVIPPWVDPSTNSNFTGSGAVWVSTDATWPGGTGNTEGNPNNDQWRLFQDTFTLPVGATVTSANIAFTADNATDVYLNGNPTPIATTGNVYGPVPVSLPYNFSNVFTASFTPGPLTNTLSFVVRNWGGNFNPNPTGLLYKAVVNYCTPNAAPECPAAPAVAAAYLQSLGIKPGSTQGKNIISQVAQHMGLQSNFDNVPACQLSNYSNAVKAYINNFLIETFTAPNSLYYNGMTSSAGLYGTGTFSFSWNKGTGVVTGGYYNEIVGGITYQNVVSSGTVSGGVVTLHFTRAVPNSYSFNLTGGSFSGNTFSGLMDGPYLFTATGTITP